MYKRKNAVFENIGMITLNPSLIYKILALIHPGGFDIPLKVSYTYDHQCICT